MMSTRTGSAKKPNAFNEANEFFYDPFPGFPVNELYSNFPWPEWNDAELNAEVWEESKGKPSSTISGLALSTTSFFEDADPPKLPVEINEYVHTWKRPHEVFQNINLIVYEPSNARIELFVPSPVAECGFNKYFGEIISLLQHYAFEDGFEVEMESPTFVPTTQGEVWKPWHHVYALTKAGKGQVHKPTYCSYGKYVLRLFYFGCWRKFVIDDRIPCDKYGLSMLPITKSSGELWPILLAKGLLKIASFTGSSIDFPFISFFTGWTCGNLTTRNKSLDQIWRRIQVLVPKFEYAVDKDEVSVAPIKGSSRKASPVGRIQPKEIPIEKFCILMATLGGFALEEADLNRVNVVVVMNRDLPLVKADKREGTKPWKRFRWVYWASNKGIWTDELLLPPYRRLQYVANETQLKSLLEPDPLQEATLYSLPEDKSSIQSFNHLGSGDEYPFEPKQWSDFYKFCEYLIEMNIFFKPSYFPSNFRMTCWQGSSLKKELNTPVTAKTAIKAEPQNAYYYPLSLRPTQNQPVLLFCESLKGILICFSLWVHPIETKFITGYLDPQQPEVLKVGHGTFVAEQCDWWTLQQGKIASYIKTIRNTSVLLNLKPGRHVLRVWINCDSPYMLNIFSNVDFCLHKGPKIRFLMKNESERILTYITNVSNTFSALILKFGKSDLPAGLKEFYNVIKPGNDSAVDYLRKLDEFIENFLYCLMGALKSLIADVDELKIMLGALRSLFLNPNIQCDLPGGQPSSLYGANNKKGVKKVTLAVKERTLSEVLLYSWTPEEIRYIITIQRVFRGYRVRLLWKYQTPTRKECKAYGDKLKKISETIFNPGKRDVEVGKIIRMIVTRNPALLETFKFHEDFPNVIDIDEFSGKVTVTEPFSWIPIARFIVASHSPGTVPCAFYFSVNLEQYVVAGVNNDTNEEIFSLANTISPQYYEANDKGYTIFIFGWNESNPKNVNWRLELVKMKYFESVHLCNTMLNAGCHPYQMPSIEVNEIKNFYVPNQMCKICRCILKVHKRSLLTLRLSTSYPEVQFALTVSLDKKYCNPDSEDFPSGNPVIANRFSTNGSAIVSSIVLENVQKSGLWGEIDDELTLYIIEAQVLNNSWPLTKREWGLVEPIRVQGETWKDMASNIQLKKAGSESRRKLTRTSKRSVQEKVVESPFWLLQILTDGSEGDPADAITAEEDHSYSDLVKAMKISWEERNPGRRKKGKDIRFKFLQAVHQDRKLTVIDEGNLIEIEEESNKFDGDFNEMLHKMTSFSYLTEDKSTSRYLKSPRILPRMPTNELISKYRKNWTESCVDSLSESLNHFPESETYEAICAEEEERREFLSLCNHYRLVMTNHLVEEQKLSNDLMEQAYQKRSKVIQRMTG